MFTTRLDLPCVVTDDDVSGTFAFVRALEEHPWPIPAENIGKTWLNNVVEKRSVFWWGGRGISTEHTAYLNLKHGIPAPASGSIAVNGKTVAEQIGAQIFIDGWALVAPNRPRLAAQMAEAAGSVSHDGDSVHAAKLWAAMEAEAFGSKDVAHLLCVGIEQIPIDSHLYAALQDVQRWVKEDGDWLKTRQRIEDNYGYDKYCGMCHVIPNHCIMVMALLYGGHDFDFAMEIINTCGWDTDCNSGNLGCLVAIMHGMEAFTKTDWRGPIADRALISTADNGYSLNNAARISFDLVNMGRRIAGKAPLPQPKDSQFHFVLPGSTQGFTSLAPIQQSQGPHGPCLRVPLGSAPVEVMTQTSCPKDILKMGSTYPMSSSPLVYSGQQVSATLYSSYGAAVSLRLKYMTGNGDLVTLDSETSNISGSLCAVQWTLPQIPESYPIAEIGIVAEGGRGDIYLDRLSWSGAPDLTVSRPTVRPHPFWDLQWVQDVTDWRVFGGTVFIANDQGEGVVSYGNKDWADYRLTVSDFCVKLGGPSGVLIRNRGLRRWYGLIFTPGVISIVKAFDGQKVELAKAALDWKIDEKLKVILQASGSGITAKVKGVSLEANDDQYMTGGMGFVVTDGALSSGNIRIQPA